MPTTEDLMKQHDESVRRHSLKRRYQAFLERWAPENRRSEFDADLMMLVHDIHSEAAKPYESLISNALMMAGTLQPILTVKKD
jgi:hypothetical protein